MEILDQATRMASRNSMQQLKHVEPADCHQTAIAQQKGHEQIIRPLRANTLHAAGAGAPKEGRERGVWERGGGAKPKLRMHVLKIPPNTKVARTLLVFIYSKYTVK